MCDSCQVVTRGVYSKNYRLQITTQSSGLSPSRAGTSDSADTDDVYERTVGTTSTNRHQTW